LVSDDVSREVDFNLQNLIVQYQILLELTRTPKTSYLKLLSVISLVTFGKRLIFCFFANISNIKFIIAKGAFVLVKVWIKKK
jgi:hypothetical protein